MYKKTWSLFCLVNFGPLLEWFIFSKTLFYVRGSKYEQISEIHVYWKCLVYRFGRPRKMCKYKWFLVNFYKTTVNCINFHTHSLKQLIFYQSLKCFLLASLISLFSLRTFILYVVCRTIITYIEFVSSAHVLAYRKIKNHFTLLSKVFIMHLTVLYIVFFEVYFINL